MLSVTNQTQTISLGDRILVARSLWARFLGLLATPTLALGEGCWLKPCKSVHTFFMRYPIEILFLDAELKIVYLTTLSPWKMSRYILIADSVLELPVGTIARSRTRVGDQLLMKEF